MDGWAILFFFSTHSFFFPFRLFFPFFSSTSLLSSLFCLFAFHLLYTSLLSLLPLLFLSPQYPQDLYNINKARSLLSLSEPLPFSLFSFPSSSRFCQILWFSSFIFLLLLLLFFLFTYSLTSFVIPSLPSSLLCLYYIHFFLPKRIVYSSIFHLFTSSGLSPPSLFLFFFLASLLLQIIRHNVHSF